MENRGPKPKAGKVSKNNTPIGKRQNQIAALLGVSLGNTVNCREYLGIALTPWNDLHKRDLADITWPGVIQKLREHGVEVTREWILQGPPHAEPRRIIQRNILGDLPQAVGWYQIGNRKFEWGNNYLAEALGILDENAKLVSEEDVKPLVHPEDQGLFERYTEKLKDLPLKQTSAGIEFRMRKQDGTYIWIGRRDTVCNYDEHGPNLAAVQMRDITDRMGGEQSAFQVLSMIESRKSVTLSQERLREIEYALADLYALMRQEGALVEKQREGLVRLFEQFRLVSSAKNEKLSGIEHKTELLGLSDKVQDREKRRKHQDWRFPR